MTPEEEAQHSAQVLKLKQSEWLMQSRSYESEIFRLRKYIERLEDAYEQLLTTNDDDTRQE